MKQSIRAEVVTGLLVALRERRPTVLCLGAGRSSSISRAVRAVGAKAVHKTIGDVSRSIAGVDVLLLSPMSANAAGRRLMDEALAAARHRGMPVVVDLTGILKLRRSLLPVRRMIAAATWPVVSTTSNELAAFADPAGKRMDPVRLAAEVLQSGGIAAIRGSTGLVTDGKSAVRVAGHRWLETAAPAGGLTAASIAAFLSVAHLADFMTVTSVALACVGQASGRAARHTKSQAMESLVVKELGALSAGASR